jgi:hypothetical protein
MAGKGDRPRPVDRTKWESAPYWKQLELRKRKEQMGSSRVKNK